MIQFRMGVKIIDLRIPAYLRKPVNPFCVVVVSR
jgi:hypothetical protein